MCYCQFPFNPYLYKLPDMFNKKIKKFKHCLIETEILQMTRNNFLKSFNYLQIKKKKKVTCVFTYILKVGNTKKS